MDSAHRWTDGEIAKLERRMSREYGTAVREMRSKLERHLAKYEEGLAKRTAKLDGTPEARKALDAWKRDRAMDRRYLEGMVESLSRDAAEATQRAMALVEDRLPSIYAENANWAAFEVDRAARLDTRFNLQDESTVRELMGRGERLFEPPRPNAAKVRAWTEQKLTAAVTQGILQGESIPHIAQRMAEVYGSDRAAAVRAARTACTGAENAGRVSSYERAEELGIEMRQEWMATLDDRTRDTHVLLDGERVEVGGTFTTANGDELRFPGDPQGPPEEVYNCRCTLVAAVDGIDQSAAARFDRLPDDMTYEDWKEAARERLEGNQVEESVIADDGLARGVVEGRDISDTWSWNSEESEFDFAIEDVMHAQGFDGLPRVVDADEFDRLYTGDQPLLLRTFSAPDAETLAAYDDMLRNGKWYVDCSNGGAQYGQGMYTAGVYGEKGAKRTQKLLDGAMKEMEHYQTVNGRSGMQSMIETMTLDPSARVVTYKEMTGSTEFKQAFKKFNSDQNYRAYTHLAADLREYVDSAEFLTDEDKRAFTKAIDKATTSLEKSRAKGTAITRSNLDYIPGDIAMRELGWTGALDDYGGYYKWLGESGLDMYADKGTRARAISSQAWQGYVTKEQYAGVYGASKGYDAINAVGHGASRSYTVVLNRTKVIIRE